MSDRDSPFSPDPVLGSLLGLGPLAVAARSLAEGLILGFGAALCALVLGAAIPPLRRQLPERFRAPASLILSTALALLYGLAAEAYFPVASAGLWLYLPLLAVNCLSLQAIRLSARQVARQAALQGEEGYQPVDVPLRFAIVLKGAGSYLVLASALGAFRELFGIGSLTLPGFGPDRFVLTLSSEAPLRLLVTPAGGFLLLGFLTALYRAILRARGRRIV